MMPKHMENRRLRGLLFLMGLLSLLVMLAPAGCAGDLDTSGSDDPGAEDQLESDAGTPPTESNGPLPDNGLLSPDGGVAVDMTQLDVQAPQPDTTPPQPDTGTTSTVGGPCPCSANTLCVEGLCRAICTAPTDPCLAVADCPGDHACLPTTANISVCVPATAQPGQGCDNKWCPVNHVCGAVDDGPFTCKPLCSNPDSACGNGGICVEAFGCMFCSSL